MEFVKGNDISAYQGDTDFSIMKSAGSKYVILRKSIGYYKDLKFWDYFDGVKNVGLPMGGYHYFYPGFSVERQFQKYIEGIQPSDLAFPPMLDVERRHSISMSRAITDVLQMLYLLKDWWTGKRMPFIYTAKFVWEDYYSRKPGWIHDWDLGVANYTNDPMPKYVPNGWTTTAAGESVPPEDQFVMWQWQADGNNRGTEHGVSSDDIDMDRMPKWYYDTFVESDDGQDDEIFTIQVVVPDSRFNVEVNTNEQT